MNNLKNILGIIILPFVAIGILVLSPVLLLSMLLTFRNDETAESEEIKQ